MGCNKKWFLVNLIVIIKSKRYATNLKIGMSFARKLNGTSIFKIKFKT